ncbi:hypothetical protein HZY97_08300 [Sphingomonas sp. R-74633]|uniref:hypothetical protein n=1 Tax=Sphingomonas sp. R-74633 TaxID=2751188 RepID=UPI0015D339EF|nr:hypothetical protein [Sphingomonas sp. R-74633]NYT40754.1 hypothetical protein [Sphingomonas sp. R-74633]
MKRVITIAALLLAGCGGNAGSNSAATGDPVKLTSGSSWDAADACASLGRDKAAAAGGTAVADAKLDKMSAGGNGLAVVSMCTFTYANGAMLTVLTREAPDDDASPDAIENARTGGGLTAPADPVPRLGKAAFWNSKTLQAQMFIDDRRYVVINFFKLPAGEDAKARSLAVAKALL